MNAETKSDCCGQAAGAMSKRAGATQPDAIHTCPMHLEVEQQGPGSCPLCGMALEPKEISLDDGPNAELIDMTRRFRLAAVFSLPLVVVVMGEHLFGGGKNRSSTSIGKG